MSRKMCPTAICCCKVFFLFVNLIGSVLLGFSIYYFSNNSVVSSCTEILNCSVPKSFDITTVPVNWIGPKRININVTHDIVLSDHEEDETKYRLSVIKDKQGLSNDAILSYRYVFDSNERLYTPTDRVGFSSIAVSSDYFGFATLMVRSNNTLLFYNLFKTDSLAMIARKELSSWPAESHKNLHVLDLWKEVAECTTCSGLPNNYWILFYVIGLSSALTGAFVSEGCGCYQEFRREPMSGRIYCTFSFAMIIVYLFIALSSQTAAWLSIYYPAKSNLPLCTDIMGCLHTETVTTSIVPTTKNQSYDIAKLYGIRLVNFQNKTGIPQLFITKAIQGGFGTVHIHFLTFNKRLCTPSDDILCQPVVQSTNRYFGFNLKDNSNSKISYCILDTSLSVSVYNELTLETLRKAQNITALDLWKDVAQCSACTGMSRLTFNICLILVILMQLSVCCVYCLFGCCYERRRRVQAKLKSKALFQYNSISLQQVSSSISSGLSINSEGHYGMLTSSNTESNSENSTSYSIETVFFQSDAISVGTDTDQPTNGQYSDTTQKSDIESQYSDTTQQSDNVGQCSPLQPMSNGQTSDTNLPFPQQPESDDSSKAIKPNSFLMYQRSEKRDAATQYSSQYSDSTSLYSNEEEFECKPGQLPKRPDPIGEG